MTLKEVETLYEKYVIPVYNRVGIAITRGKGSWVWDATGKRYLDFFPGWGVDALGHCHPHVTARVKEQMRRLIHVPNSYYHEPQAQLARELVRSSFDGKVFFANSGAEAVESAIKLARKYGNPTRWEIITMEGSFHGRTLGAIAATGQVKHQQGFEPIPEGFRHVPFNRIDAVERSIGPRTAAVMLELVQGEGGVHVASKEYVKQLRQLCDRKKLLLIFDEIQTGMGRTGTLFCYEQYGVTPDILLLAKAVAGGLPMSVLIARRLIADTWPKGSHATTFGGNPLVTAAGLAVLEVIRKEKLLANVRRQGNYLRGRLARLQKRLPVIREVRGLGLMIGVELEKPGAGTVAKAASRGLLINCTQERVIRLLPALNVTKFEIDHALSIVEEVLKEL